MKEFPPCKLNTSFLTSREHKAALDAYAVRDHIELGKRVVRIETLSEMTTSHTVSPRIEDN